MGYEITTEDVAAFVAEYSAAGPGGDPRVAGLAAVRAKWECEMRADYEARIRELEAQLACARTAYTGCSAQLAAAERIRDLEAQLRPRVFTPFSALGEP